MYRIRSTNIIDSLLRLYKIMIIMMQCFDEFCFSGVSHKIFRVDMLLRCCFLFYSSKFLTFYVL